MRLSTTIWPRRRKQGHCVLAHATSRAFQNGELLRSPVAEHHRSRLILQQQLGFFGCAPVLNRSWAIR
jgi:hypothetical protein